MKQFINQQLFIKGELYTTNRKGLIVMCTKTTCNYSSESFKGVVIESEEHPKGHNSKWLLSGNFVEYKKD